MRTTFRMHGIPMTVALTLTVALASGLAAQPSKEVMVRDWERYRENVLAFVEAMPEELLSFKPTPEVRTFAEQIEHICRDNVGFVATGIRGIETPPPMGNPKAYLRAKRELSDWASRTFDFVLDVLEETGQAELETEGVVFGSYPMPKHRVFEAAMEHGIWTLGQLVPYLRLNGIEPPSYRLFEEG